MTKATDIDDIQARRRALVKRIFVETKGKNLKNV